MALVNTLLASLLTLAAGALGPAALAAAQSPTSGTPAFIAAALADPGRPAADVARDPLRKPGELLVFAGLQPGAKVADMIPEGGYFTRIFAKAVGPRGHVYAWVPEEFAKHSPKTMLDPTTAIAAQPGYANVSVLVQPTGALASPQPLDLAWTSQNYHDVYGFEGADTAEAMDKAVYAALKPGGVYIVIDHVAPAGAGGAVATTLHRIELKTVEAQVLAAGFTLEGQSPLLANPADPHDVKVFDPSIKGRTDQFVLKFRKPA